MPKKAEVRQIWRCVYCNKYYLVRHACETHERYCGKNPTNDHKCLKYCKHLRDGGIGIERFWCASLREPLYSFGAERSPSMHGHLGNMVRMPHECEHYICDLGEDQ